MWFSLSFLGFAVCAAGFAGVVLPRLVALGLLAPWAASAPVLSVFGVTRPWHGPVLLVLGFVVFLVALGQGVQRDTQERDLEAARSAPAATLVP